MRHLMMNTCIEIKIESCMSACPISISPNAYAIGTARIMEEEKIGGLPVVEAGRLIGMIAVSDLEELLVRILIENSAWYWNQAEVSSFLGASSKGISSS
jgi:predicted transcriptional regulator